MTETKSFQNGTNSLGVSIIDQIFSGSGSGGGGGTIDVYTKT
jgi:hypothetical protein